MAIVEATAGSVAWSCGDSSASSVRVPPRWLASDGSTLTSTPPPAGARAVGWLPTWMDRTEPACGSIRHTLPPWLSAAQTAPSANAMPAGEPPTLTFRARPVPGSTRATAPPRSPTQTLPGARARHPDAPVPRRQPGRSGAQGDGQHVAAARVDLRQGAVGGVGDP